MAKDFSPRKFTQTASQSRLNYNKMKTLDGGFEDTYASQKAKKPQAAYQSSVGRDFLESVSKEVR